MISKARANALCECSIKLLGAGNAQELSRLSTAARLEELAIRTRSCHPNKQAPQDRQTAIEIQMALQMAKREVIEAPINAARYLQTGVPRISHDCLHTGRICRSMEDLLIKREDMTERGDRQRSLLDFFAGKLRSRPRSSPPSPRGLGPRLASRMRMAHQTKRRLSSCDIFLRQAKN